MTIRPGNAQHQGAREYQQDSFAFSDLEDAAFVTHGGVLGVIADGMGGLAYGGQAGLIAVRTFLARYQSKGPDEPIPDVLAAALERANAAVVELAKSSGQIGNVGATLVAAVVHGQRLYWTSVGDSRVYLLRGGHLDQLTLDHIYGAELDLKVAAGALSAETASKDPDRDALTSHLGKECLTEIDRSIHALPLECGDRVFLCTDGLYRALAPDELARYLIGNPQRACEELVDRAVRKRLPGQDNLTALALAIDGETPAGAMVDEPDGGLRPWMTRLRLRAVSMVAAAVLLVLLGAGVWWWRHRPPSPAPGRANGLPMVTLPSNAAPPASQGARGRDSEVPSPSDRPAQGEPRPEGK